MSLTPEQVEQIVQQVIRQFSGSTGAGAVAPSTATATVAASAPQPTAPQAPAGVKISHRVITHNVLAEEAGGAKVVRIDAKAIITPSAHDYLRQQSIQIVRETATASAPAKGIRWLVLVSKSTPAVKAIAESLPSLQVTAQSRLVGVAAEAAVESISALCRGEVQQVVVFTEQPELVACLANRNDRVRGASSADVVAIERIRQHLQANLLALDPAHKGIHELKAILKAFRAA